MRCKGIRQVADGHSIHPRRTLVAHHRSHCRCYVIRRTDRLHQMPCHCRTFAFGRRRTPLHQLAPVRIRVLPDPVEEAPCIAGFSVFQRSRVMRATCPVLYPLSGTVQAFSRWSGLLRPLLTSAPRSVDLSTPSVPWDTTQISWGKPRSFPRTPAGFTAAALDGYGLCD